MKKYQEKQINIKDLITNTVQPPGRARAGAVQNALKTSLEKNGLLKPIMVGALKDGSFVVLDGHRTLAAAKELGWKTIACAVTPMSAAETETTFMSVNDCTRQMRAREYLYQWAIAADRSKMLEAMGSHRAVYIRRFERIFGTRAAVEYGKTNNVDPSIVNVIGLVVRAISVYQKPPTESIVGHWLIKHRSSVQARFAATYGSKRQVVRLANAIEAGEKVDFRSAPRVARARRVDVRSSVQVSV